MSTTSTSTPELSDDAQTFSPRSSKNRYTVKYAIVEEPNQPENVANAQREFLEKLVDNVAVPSELEDFVMGTQFHLELVRDAVRYAQDRCAEIVILVTEQDLECAQLGLIEKAGDYYTTMRNQIETFEEIPRGQHIGDETWLQSASPSELIQEMKLCVTERYYMEGTWANMDGFIKMHKATKEKQEAGMITVYKKGDDQSETRALYKYAAGSVRGLRAGRGGRRGRGGGTLGRSKSEGSFRGGK